MPNMDGLEATRHIRQEIPKLDQPCIIALTANAFNESVEQCIQSGMDDVLTKPISFAELEATLLSKVRQRNPTDNTCIS